MLNNLISINSFAQNADDFEGNFTAIFNDATNDFKNIKTKIADVDSIKSEQYFNCSKTLGSGLEAIMYNYKDNSCFFASKFNYANTDELVLAQKIINPILNKINDMIKSGKYKGWDDGPYTFVTDLEGNYILELETGKENSYLKVTIYGKSWGKK